MEKVCPCCGQPSDRGRVKNRTEQTTPKKTSGNKWKRIFQAKCPYYHQTNSVKALMGTHKTEHSRKKLTDSSSILMHMIQRETWETSNYSVICTLFKITFLGKWDVCGECPFL